MSHLDLSPWMDRVRTASLPQPSGRVRDVVGVLVEVEGMTASVGSELEVALPNRRLRLEVLGFRQSRILTAPLGSTAGVAPGMRVRAAGRNAMVAVDGSLLGRVTDAFGAPLTIAYPDAFSG